MTQFSFGYLLRWKAFLPGLIFFGLNTHHLYSFYHVNSYKMVYMGIALTLAFSYIIIRAITQSKFVFSWKESLLFLLPTLGTLPGNIFNSGVGAYNFPYELATDLIVLLWIVLIVDNCKDNRDLQGFLIWYGISMLYVVFVSILERYGVSFLVEGGGGRVKASYGNINYLAGAMVPAAPFFLALIFPSLSKFKEKIKKNTAYYTYFFIILSSVLLILWLTVTRAAIAASVGAMFVTLILLSIVFLQKKYLKYALLFYITIISFSIIAVIVFINNPNLAGFIHHRFQEIFEGKIWHGRFVAWTPAIAGFFASPIIGFGLGSYYNVFFSFIQPDSRLFHVERSYNHAHSEWLEFLAEGGILGYLGFIILWGYVFRKLYLILKTKGIPDFDKSLAIGIFGGFVGFYLHGVFSVAQRMIVTNIPFYVLLAIAFILIKRNKIVKTQNIVETNNEIKQTSSRILLLPPVFKVSFQKFFSFLYNGQGISKTCSISAIVVIIGSGWLLYYGWAVTQYQYTKVLKGGRNFSSFLKLENLPYYHNDIYALDDLSRRQIGYKKFDKAIKTLDTIQELIPHYRINGFLKSVAYYRNRQTQKAVQEAVIYQKRDGYLKENLTFLTIIFAQSGKPQLLFKQIERNFKIILSKNTRAQFLGYEVENIKFHVAKNLQFPVDIKINEININIYFSEEFSRQIAKFIKNYYQKRNNKLRNILENYVRQSMISNPNLYLKANDGINNPRVNSIIKKYQNKLKGKISRINNGEELTILKENTNWDKYRSIAPLKSSIIKSMVNTLGKI